MKLLFAEGAAVSAGDITFERFEKYGDIQVFENLSYDELKIEIADADVLFCNKLRVDSSVLDCAKKLKYIGECATGYNNIDIEYCRKKGITVSNAGGYSTSAVAQQTFAYILNFFSKVSDYDTFVKNDGWIKSPVFSPIAFPTDEISGKTIGIIGYGSIGRSAEKIARAFDMNVLVHTRTVRDNGETSFVSMERLLAESDIVTVHCPLTADNAKMFNKQTFAKFKRGAYFINTARGGLVEEQALFDALASGHLAGAAIDVLETEPMKPDCILKDAPNITITPHSAWVPLTTRRRLMDIVEKNLAAFLSGNPQNVVT